MGNGCVSFWLIDPEAQAGVGDKRNLGKHYGAGEEIPLHLFTAKLAVDKVFT